MLATDQILNKGRYRIINSVCQDDAGATYDAYDTVSDTRVVLRETVGKFGKVATPSQVTAFNEAFANGAEVLTGINHESLVTVQNYFSEIDRQYLVLDSDGGSDLTKFLNGNGSRPGLAQVLSWSEQLLSALSHLHKLSPPVFHRDIRPENIKLIEDGRIKLIMTGVGTSHPSAADTLTSNRTVSNTSFHYRPLEQLWAGLDSTSQRVILNDYEDRAEAVLLRPFDSRSELYSFAASLYHVLTGTLPFDALDRSIAVHEGKPDPLLSPSDLDANIPHEISKIFLTAMAIRRESRFVSATILLQVLRSAAVRVSERGTEEAKTTSVSMPLADSTETVINAAAPLTEVRHDEVTANTDQQLHEPETTGDQSARVHIEQEAAISGSAQPVEEENPLDFDKAPFAVNDMDDEVVLELEPSAPTPGRTDFLDESDPVEPLSADPFETTYAEEDVWRELLNDDVPSSPSIGLKIPAMAVAAVLLVAGIVGAWKVLSVSEPQPSHIEQQLATPVGDGSRTPVGETNQSPDHQSFAESEPSTMTSATEPVSGDESAKHVQQIARQEKVKKPAVTAAKTPLPKKKVTIDDLIKDN